MKLDPTCPVELIRHEVLQDDREHARAYLDLRCCSEHAPRRIEGCVRWIDKITKNYTESSFEMVLSPLEPHSVFSVPVSASFVPQDVKLLVYFTRVLLSDGSEWTGGPETLRIYPDQPDLPGHLANSLSAAAGVDAVCCAQEMENGDWLCVCGRWNDRAEGRCKRCGREKNETLDLFSPEAVENLVPPTGPIDIEPPLTDRAASEPQQAKRSSPLKRVLVAVLLAAVFACMALGVRCVRYSRSNAAGLMPTSHIHTINS